MLNTFEMKALRRIFGPTKVGQLWRIRYNKELYDLFKRTRDSIYSNNCKTYVGKAYDGNGR
jgi:hypothetical protein